MEYRELRYRAANVNAWISPDRATIHPTLCYTPFSPCFASIPPRVPNASHPLHGSHSADFPFSRNARVPIRFQQRSRAPAPTLNPLLCVACWRYAFVVIGSQFFFFDTKAGFRENRWRQGMEWLFFLHRPQDFWNSYSVDGHAERWRGFGGGLWDAKWYLVKLNNRDDPVRGWLFRGPWKRLGNTDCCEWKCWYRIRRKVSGWIWNWEIFAREIHFDRCRVFVIFIIHFLRRYLYEIWIIISKLISLVKNFY